MMEYKRLLKVLHKKFAELDALMKSPNSRGKAHMKKMRRLVNELDEIIWRAQLDYQPAGKQFRAQLAELESVLNASNN